MKHAHSAVTMVTVAKIMITVPSQDTPQPELAVVSIETQQVRWNPCPMNTLTEEVGPIPKCK